MEAFELKRLLNDKVEVSAIIANMNASADYEQYLMDQLCTFEQRSQTGERIDSNINVMHEIKRKLDEVHEMMSALHEDNVCVNVYKL